MMLTWDAQVVEGDDDLMNLPGMNDSDEYIETASRRSCSSSALLEAAVSSAVNHPNVVQTYDYRVFDPDVAVLNSSTSYRSPIRVRNSPANTDPFPLSKAKIGRATHCQICHP